MQKVQTINLAVPATHLQLILQALAEQPYKLVAGTVQLLERQATADLERQAADAAPAAVETP